MSIENESAFERLMSQRGAPGEGFDFDMEVRVPKAASLREEELRRRQEAKAVALEAEVAREASDDALAAQRGERGGSGEAAGTAGTAGSQQSASAPEAAPQADDPDDGEHTDSVVAQEEEPVPAPEKVVEPQEAPQAPQNAVREPSEGAEGHEGAQEGSAPVQGPQELPQGPRLRAETQQVPVEGGFDRNVKFSHEGKGVQLARFPEEIVSALTARLSVLTGGAEPPHNAPLVTGFLLAALGLDASDYDENTRLAARLFAAGDSPRLAAIEEALAGLTGMMGRLGAGQRSHTKALKETAEAVEAAAIAQAYSISDRLEGSGKEDRSGASADFANKQTVATLENMRRTARQRIRDQEISAGRPLR